ncbi:hypothetical protein BDZ85DRAFT_272752 [Elsinoe ampelina]|uniref:Uncharacterized protein n=1 Tax=Elsinoe ampelina TaxID=302913 RepID=A0A6A6GGQ7_9PEZI|nr:hypothetical protein BDZ85DRAFT_272752 [Elsinoe ampelina]
MPHIILLGTLDTKLQEFKFLHSQLLSNSNFSRKPRITVIDCGRSEVKDDVISIRQTDLVTKHGSESVGPLSSMSRGEVIKFMTSCATKCVKQLIATENVHAIFGAGGSGGTSLISAVMRDAAPIGMPKLIVSTIASGDTGSLVGETDITMMYSVVDIAGSNSILDTVLANAAAAILAMAANHESKKSQHRDQARLRIGITMFGVTTPGVNAIRHRLEHHHQAEVLVFHATGHGGKAMERLVREGQLDAVIDLTTTEICDHLLGGNMSAGPNRLEAALKAGTPTIISLGAPDMVNFGPIGSVPAKYEKRKLLEHNPTVTLMRTSAEECKAVGGFILDKINRFASNPHHVQVWVPTGGISMVAVPGAVFHDASADKALFSLLRSGLQGKDVKLIEDDRDINDKDLAISIADALIKIINDCAR